MHCAHAAWTSLSAPTPHGTTRLAIFIRDLQICPPATRLDGHPGRPLCRSRIGQQTGHYKPPTIPTLPPHHQHTITAPSPHHHRTITATPDAHTDTRKHTNTHIRAQTTHNTHPQHCASRHSHTNICTLARDLPSITSTCTSLLFCELAWKDMIHQLSVWSVSHCCKRNVPSLASVPLAALPGGLLTAQGPAPRGRRRRM